MHRQWLWFEHERLHQVERWPDGPTKEATLAAIRSTIAMLRLQAPTVETPECSLCLSHVAELAA